MARWWQWSVAVANTLAFGAGQGGVRLLLQTLRLRGVGQELRSALQLIGTLAGKQALLLATHLAPDPSVGAAESLVVEALATLSSSYVAVRTGSGWGS
jgi:hypothetical protein